MNSKYFQFVATLFFVVLINPFLSLGYTVTQLTALYQNGQVFLTWHNPSGSNLQYNVYRSSTPLNNSNQLTSNTYLGFVRDNSGKNVRKSEISGTPFYFVITPNQAPLASDRGLYVVTCTSSSVYYYAVTVTDLSNNLEAKSITMGSNSLQSGVSEMIAKPQAVLQTITTQVTGDTSYEYVIWGNNQNLSHWRAFNNVGSYGYNFTLQKRGTTYNKPLYVEFQDNDPFAPLGLGFCSDCNMLELDDRLPNGQNTYWIGYNDSYNMYTENLDNPIVTTGTINTYTQAITQSIIRWSKRQAGVDSNRIYMTGGSHNGFGCLLTAMNMPSEIACIYTTVAPIVFKVTSSDNRQHGLCASGADLPTDVYYPGTTTPISIWSFCKMATYYRINTGGIPYAQGVHGKNDVTVGWVQKFHWYDSLDISTQGGTWFWDQRTHSSSSAQFNNSETEPDYERYASNRSYPAFSNCSINQNWGTGGVMSGDAYGAINGYLDWYDNSISDQACSYTVKCFVKNFYVGGQLDAHQYDSCFTNITLRRTQQFLPTNGQTINWTNYGATNNLLQSGSFVYNGGTITLTGIKIKKTGSTVTVQLGNSQSGPYYADADGDGYGNPSITTNVCSIPPGYVTNNTDCNDANASIHPNATEICNNIDDNCSGTIDEGVKTTFYRDADGDGYGNVGITTLACTAPTGYVSNSTDCNDGNSSIRPNATEVCNSIDDNCNGQIDEGTLITFYRDVDGDGYGTTSTTTQSCTAPSGYVSNSTDCNDGNASIRPGAAEVCNSIDDNCSGQVDEGVQITFYRDADGDGYGSSVVTTQACSAPTGYLLNHTDCNDANASVHPNTAEICNSIDDNCNGTVDEGVKITFYRDVDLDGYGNAGVTILACSAPSGYVSNSTDCNDANASIHPNTTEICNSLDDNCNGTIDEGVKITYYRDVDVDGYGNASVTTQACSAPSGYVSNNTDCNDANASIHPNTTEVCNSVDDNCNGTIDEGVKITFFADTDADGYGNASVTTQACSAPSGYVSSSTDCNDANASIHPNTTEVCNSVDDNCNGTIDEGVKITFFADTDADGYGNASVTTQACSAPSGYVSNSTDCNDANAAIHPNTAEICNGTDDNCNGTVDEGVKSTFYIDADGDGFGNTSVTTQACSAPSGYSSNSTDCDDVNFGIHPGAAEICNGADDNCDGTIDEGVKVTLYADADGDGYGNSTIITQACSVPPGYVPDNTDCNDANGSIHPGASEACNYLDDNCDGQTDEGVKLTFYADSDGDAFGNANITIQSCSVPSGYVSVNTDCNDGNPSINPNTAEVCNGTDDNCDGQIDEGVKITFFADADGDGYGNVGVTTQACSAPLGYVTNISDCNDGNAAVNPNSAEVCNNADDNCDGQIDEGVKITFFADTDNDGYGTTTVSTQACSAPLGYVSSSTDCNDSNASINPNAAELCNSTDDNCDGQIDEGVKITFFMDADGDGYGNVSVTTQACSAPSGYVSTNTDCSDNNNSINPGASELCNQLDDNCNGQTDEGSISATTAPSGNVSICSGSNIMLQANTGTGLIYQWQKNGSNISGATNSSYSATTTGTFTVVETSGTCTSTSADAIVNVNALPTATIYPSGIIRACPGISMTLTANSGSELSYQWFKSTSAISGATAANYSVPTAGTFSVRVTGTNGCSKTSSNTTVQSIAFSIQISYTGNLNICSAGSVTFSALVVTGYSYQWYKENVAISGATATSYIATQPGSYKYLATTPEGCTKYSSKLTVTGCKLDEPGENEPGELLSVFPNPFSQATTILFSLPQSENVSLKIYDAVGRLLSTLADETMSEGSHQVKWDASNQNLVSTGIYLLKMETPNHSETIQLSVIK